MVQRKVEYRRQPSRFPSLQSDADGGNSTSQWLLARWPRWSRRPDTAGLLLELVQEAPRLTIPQLLRRRAQLTPYMVALRAKELGVWREYSWSKLYDLVRQAALGLRALGVGRGDAVAVMGDPCWEYIVSDFAILSAGAISFGIYTTCSHEEVLGQLQTARARLFLAENQEYVDKFLAVADRVPQVEKVIVFDTRGTFLYEDPRLMSFSDLLQLGEKCLRERPEEFDRLVDEGSPDDPAILIFTSGTTGAAKAAIVSHRNYIVGGALAFVSFFPDLLWRQDRLVCHLTLAHAFERIFTLYTSLISAATVHVGESPELLAETLFEVQPTIFQAVPRIWSRMAGHVLAEIARSDPLKRWAHRLAMWIGRRRLQRRWSGRSSLLWEILYQVAWWLSFRHILDKAGLARCRLALTGGSDIPPAVQEIWQVWGLDLRNLYGATEAAYITMQVEPYPRPGDVGVAFPGTEVTLGPDGQILVRGPGVFKGYLNRPEQKVDAEGWLHTGDLGELSADGKLRVVGRADDIMVTAGGKNIAATEIENLVKASPYVSEAVLVAHGRKFPAMLIEIDYETVSDWARRNGIPYTDYRSLAQHPAVYELIGRAVAEANAKLARVEQVKKFRIIPRELDPEYGDTTPTRKIKRAHFYRMFADLIAEMYAEETEEVQQIQAALGQERRSIDE